jgi:hypothetical protein
MFLTLKEKRLATKKISDSGGNPSKIRLNAARFLSAFYFFRKNFYSAFLCVFYFFQLAGLWKTYAKACMVSILERWRLELR